MEVRHFEKKPLLKNAKIYTLLNLYNWVVNIYVFWAMESNKTKTKSISRTVFEISIKIDIFCFFIDQLIFAEMSI